VLNISFPIVLRRGCIVHQEQEGEEYLRFIPYSFVGAANTTRAGKKAIALVSVGANENSMNPTHRR
jgi:hypothetical protein